MGSNFIVLHKGLLMQDWVFRLKVYDRKKTIFNLLLAIIYYFPIVLFMEAKNSKTVTTI